MESHLTNRTSLKLIGTLASYLSVKSDLRVIIIIPGIRLFHISRKFQGFLRSNELTELP